MEEGNGISSQTTGYSTEKENIGRTERYRSESSDEGLDQNYFFYGVIMGDHRLS